MEKEPQEQSEAWQVPGLAGPRAGQGLHWEAIAAAVRATDLGPQSGMERGTKPGALETEPGCSAC